MEKPNLFRIATSELSQDAFFVWLLSWAKQTYKGTELYHMAHKFLAILIGKDTDWSEKEIIISRQWKNIDIFIDVVNEVVITIEAKTNSCQHSGQLGRYKTLVLAEARFVSYPEKHFVYLKTGNESAISLKEVTDQGYLIVDRGQLLEAFSAYKGDNDIFLDYVENLAHLHKLSNPTTLLELWDWYGCMGLFKRLEVTLSQEPFFLPTKWETDRHYLGFWYYGSVSDKGNLHIEIKYNAGKPLSVQIRLTESDGLQLTLEDVFNQLTSIAFKIDLVCSRPYGMKASKNAAVSQIKNCFVEVDGQYDFEHIIITLSKVQGAIDEFCKANPFKIKI